MRWQLCERRDEPVDFFFFFFALLDRHVAVILIDRNEFVPNRSVIRVNLFAFDGKAEECAVYCNTLPISAHFQKTIQIIIRSHVWAATQACDAFVWYASGFQEEYTLYPARWIFRIFLIYIKICELIKSTCTCTNLRCKIDFFLLVENCATIFCYFFFLLNKLKDLFIICKQGSRLWKKK